MLPLLVDSLSLTLPPARLGHRHFLAAGQRAGLAAGPAALLSTPMAAPAAELPQMLLADEGGIFGLVATGIVALFVVFIAGYAFQALQCMRPDAARRPGTHAAHKRPNP